MIAIIKNTYTNEVVEKIAITEQEKRFWNWLERNGYLRTNYQLFITDRNSTDLALKKTLDKSAEE